MAKAQVEVGPGPAWPLGAEFNLRVVYEAFQKQSEHGVGLPLLSCSAVCSLLSSMVLGFLFLVRSKDKGGAKN